MKINIHEIPPSGKDYILSNNEVWVKELLERAGFESNEAFSSNINVIRSKDNIIFRGTISGVLKLLCSKCCEPYAFKFEREFVSTYCREYGSKRGLREEVRLTKGDLDLTFYSGEEIDLVELLNEQLQLALPYRPVCKEECKGICFYCGKDLNIGDCKCEKRNWGLKFSSIFENRTL